MSDAYSATGFAVMLGFTLHAWALTAAFWSVGGGIVSTIAVIASAIYLDRLRAQGGGE